MIVFKTHSKSVFNTDVHLLVLNTDVFHTQIQKHVVIFVSVFNTGIYVGVFDTEGLKGILY